MLQFPSADVGACDEVDWVLVAKNAQRVVVAVLLDVAVSGEVLAGRRPRYQVGAGDEKQGAGVVAVAEVHLSEPESVFIVVYANS